MSTGSAYWFSQEQSFQRVCAVIARWTMPLLHWMFGAKPQQPTKGQISANHQAVNHGVVQLKCRGDRNPDEEVQAQVHDLRHVDDWRCWCCSNEFRDKPPEYFQSLYRRGGDGRCSCKCLACGWQRPDCRQYGSDSTRCGLGGRDDIESQHLLFGGSSANNASERVYHHDVTAVNPTKAQAWHVDVVQGSSNSCGGSSNLANSPVKVVPDVDGVDREYRSQGENAANRPPDASTPAPVSGCNGSHVTT